jgi:1-acyl-sn-glycerol-3-phosphate acyltransferase
MTATGPLKLTVRGEEKLKAGGSRLVIANHPTLIDAVVLLSLVPDAVCIVKAELTHSFLIRELIRSTGYITNSQPERILEECKKRLSRGQSLLLFPEGTRSSPGKPLKLLRGAAQIALRAEHDLTPVVITCRPASLLKGHEWYQVPPEGPVRMSFEVFDDISIAPYQSENEGISLRSRKLTRYLTDYFQQHLQRPADL